MTENKGFFAKYFDFAGNKTTLGTEISAGLTTFMTMAYILAVNPSILSAAGMDAGAVFTATVLSSVVAIIIMALYAKLPFALAPGMGLNAYFAFTVVGILGYSWQVALAAVFIEGVIFILLGLLNVREAIINSIPMSIKKAISAGIGLFIAFIGLNNAGIVGPGDGTPLQLGDLTSAAPLVALLGIIITGILLAYRVKGAILIGIAVTTVIAIPAGLVTLPDRIVSLPPSMAPTFLALELDGIFSLKFWVIVFTFLMIDMFDTVGTLVGVATKSNMLDHEGRVPRAKQALMADAIGTVAGALFGTSTVTTFVESAAGVGEGGRTGMTALSTGFFFLLSLLLAPIFLMIPSAATAPALVIVGAMMMSPIKEIDLEDMSTAIPAFLTLVMMPFAYSISEGIAFGIVSFVLIKLFSKRFHEIPVLTYFVALLFILSKVLL